MILIKKPKIVEAVIGMHTGIAQSWKITMRDLNGKFLYETDWLVNMITNGALNRMGNRTCANGSPRVGSGTTPTTPTMLNMEAEYVGATFGTIDYGGYATGAPHYTNGGYYIWRLAAGQATGPINEVGYNNNNDVNGLNARVVLPVTINKAADQIMDITIRWEVYREVGLADTGGTFDISGVNYTYTIRGAYMGTGSGYWGRSVWTASSNSSWAVLSDFDTFTAVTGHPFVSYPSVEKHKQDSSSYGTYITDSFTLDQTYVWEVGNSVSDVPVTGIALIDEIGASAQYPYSDGGAGWQILFEQTVGGGPLIKTGDEELHLTFRKTWGRYTP